MHPWEGLLSETDKRVIERGGYGKPRGLGRRPVLVVIDCQYNYIGDDRPVDEQQDHWPAGGGAAAWAAVRAIAGIRNSAQEAGVPVIYTRNVQKKTLRFDSFSGKSTWDKSRTLDGDPGTEIVAELAPSPEDIVVDKSYASAFYGTPLATYLVGLEADTVVLTGVSTGGCVRATAVDAVTRGYRATVVADAVADRIDVSHKVALLDLWMKYTDLTDTDGARAYFGSLHGGNQANKGKDSAK